MRLFYYGKDGGPESKVWGFWLIEWKPLISIALLRFEEGSRDAFHTHAFNSVTWLLWGHLIEEMFSGAIRDHRVGLEPIVTLRKDFHQVKSVGRSWAITFRGPWVKNWREFIPSTQQHLMLETGRHIVSP